MTFEKKLYFDETSNKIKLKSKENQQFLFSFCVKIH